MPAALRTAGEPGVEAGAEAEGELQFAPSTS